jgi:hypothetical protein
MVDPTYVSVTANVRRLARNVIVADFSDAQIIHEQEAAYAAILIATGKSDWAAADNRFPAVQKIEEELAAAYILEHYGQGTSEELAWIQYWTSSANSLIISIKDNTTDPEEDANVLVANSRYISYPASLEDDDNAMPYRSTNVTI